MYVEELFKLSLAAYTKASNLSSFASTMLYELKDLKKNIFHLFKYTSCTCSHNKLVILLMIKSMLKIKKLFGLNHMNKSDRRYD